MSNKIDEQELKEAFAAETSKLSYSQQYREAFPTEGDNYQRILVELHNVKTALKEQVEANKQLVIALSAVVDTVLQKKH